MPIEKVLKDGDKVAITVKDCSVTPTTGEKRWYDQAFGKEMHIMKIEIEFDPKTELLQKASNDINVYIEVNYQMFPEHAEEFSDRHYEEEFEVQMKRDILTGDVNTFVYNLELPYGDIDFKYFYTMKDDEEKKEILADDKSGVIVSITPEYIISEEEQRIKDEEEEKENKRRDDQKKEEHKREKEERKQEAIEKRLQLETQNRNAQKLDIYWRVMDLDFHTSPENANTSLSIFALFYDEIKSYFEYYTKLQYQFYTRVENHSITLHSFMHFLKLFRIAVSRDEVRIYFQRLDSLIIPPPENVLNVKNGLNFAQFLEAIMRIVYAKVENSDASDEEEEYRRIMTEIFRDGTMEIQRKSTENPIIIGLHAEDSQILFYGKYKLLGAIYENKSVTKSGIGIGLSFEFFYTILEESGLAQVEEPKEDDTENLKISKEEVMSVLNEIEVFDMDIDDENDPKVLVYPDFLDALVRIADRLSPDVAQVLEEKDYSPLTEENEMVNINITNKKLVYVIYMIEQKYSGIEQEFVQSLEQKDNDLNFQCKMVVNERGDEDYDEGEYDEDEGDEDEYN